MQGFLIVMRQGVAIAIFYFITNGLIANAQDRADIWQLGNNPSMGTNYPTFII